MTQVLINEFFDAINNENASQVTTVLQRAVSQRQLETVLTAKDSSSQDIGLALSIRMGYDDCTKAIYEVLFQNITLLEKVSKIKDEYESTPIVSIISSGNLTLFNEIKDLARNAKKLAEFLGAKDLTGRTPLHWAVIEGQKEIIESQFDEISADANLKPLASAQDNDDSSPLHWAVDGDQAEIVDLFMQKGATEPKLLEGMLTAVDGTLRTTLMYAIATEKSEAVIKSMLSALIASKDVGLIKKVLVELADNTSSTPLLVLMEDKYKATVEYIFEQAKAAGVLSDVLSFTISGQTLEEVAVGQTEILGLIHTYQVQAGHAPIEPEVETQVKTLAMYDYAKFNAAVYSHDTARLEKEVKGWKLLIDSDKAGVSNSGYFGAVYTNESSKEIIIANSGTSFHWNPLDLVRDLWSGGQVWAGYIPNQFTNGASKLVDKALEELTKQGKNTKDYNYISTGHSLGAVLSNLVAVKLANDGFSVQSTIFDSPGSKTVMGEYYQQLEAEKKFNPDAIEPNLKIETYNAKPSYVNSIDKHPGSMFEVAIDKHLFSSWMHEAFDNKKGGTGGFAQEPAYKGKNAESDLVKNSLYRLKNSQDVHKNVGAARLQLKERIEAEKTRGQKELQEAKNKSLRMETVRTKAEREYGEAKKAYETKKQAADDLQRKLNEEIKKGSIQTRIKKITDAREKLVEVQTKEKGLPNASNIKSKDQATKALESLKSEVGALGSPGNGKLGQILTRLENALSNEAHVVGENSVRMFDQTLRQEALKVNDIIKDTTIADAVRGVAGKVAQFITNLSLFTEVLEQTKKMQAILSEEGIDAKADEVLEKADKKLKELKLAEEARDSALRDVQDRSSRAEEGRKKAEEEHNKAKREHEEKKQAADKLQAQLNDEIEKEKLVGEQARIKTLKIPEAKNKLIEAQTKEKDLLNKNTIKSKEQAIEVLESLKSEVGTLNGSDNGKLGQILTRLMENALSKDAYVVGNNYLIAFDQTLRQEVLNVKNVIRDTAIDSVRVVAGKIAKFISDLSLFKDLEQAKSELEQARIEMHAILSEEGSGATVDELIAEADKKLEQLKSDETKAKTAIPTLETQLATARQQEAEAEKSLAQASIASLKARQEKLKAETALQTALEGNPVLEAQLADLRQQEVEAQASMDRASIALLKARQEKLKAETAIETTREDNNKAHKELVKLLKTELDKMKSELNVLKSSKKARTEAREKAESAFEEAKQALKEAKQKKVTAQGDFETANEQLKSVQGRLDAAKQKSATSSVIAEPIKQLKGELDIKEELQTKKSAAESKRPDVLQKEQEVKDALAKVKKVSDKLPQSFYELQNAISRHGVSKVVKSVSQAFDALIQESNKAEKSGKKQSDKNKQLKALDKQINIAETMKSYLDKYKKFSEVKVKYDKFVADNKITDDTNLAEEIKALKDKIADLDGQKKLDQAAEDKEAVRKLTDERDSAQRNVDSKKVAFDEATNKVSTKEGEVTSKNQEVEIAKKEESDEAAESGQAKVKIVTEEVVRAEFGDSIIGFTNCIVHKIYGPGDSGASTAYFDSLSTDQQNIVMKAVEINTLINSGDIKMAENKIGEVRSQLSADVHIDECQLVKDDFLVESNLVM